MKYDSCLALYDLAKEIDWKGVRAQLKPGAHVVSITPLLEHHRVTAAMEDCGIEIRDCILFLGTPSYMIALGRLPLEGTVAENTLKHGVGGLNIDVCRITTEDNLARLNVNPSSARSRTFSGGVLKARYENNSVLGRWPANVILSSSPEVLGKFPESKGQQGAVTGKEPSAKTDVAYGEFASRRPFETRGDTGSAARFFYNVTEDNSLPELIGYLCKLCTPPQGKALVVGLESEAIIALEGNGFNISEYRRNFEHSSNVFQNGTLPHNTGGGLSAQRLHLILKMVFKDTPHLQ